MPYEDEPTREPFLKKWFFGSSARAEGEEKVLRYIIHRVNGETPLHDVIREDYVRRNCSEDKIHELVNDPEFVHACRENLWQTFRSGELDPGLGRRRSQPSTNDRPADGADVSGSASAGSLIGPVSRRSTPPNRCDHKGPATVEPVEGGYSVQCIICRKVGPVRKTPEAARKALLVLGVRDGPRQEGPA